MRRFTSHKRTAVNGRLYQDILDETKVVFRKYLSKATPMYVDPIKKRELLGWHLLLSKDEENADYFVLYETKLFDSVAQIRFMSGEYQLQYTLEPDKVIMLSQFRLRELSNDYTDWTADDLDDDLDGAVISIGQPITDIEARGLLAHLKTVAK